MEFRDDHLGYTLLSYSSKLEARKAVRKMNGTNLDGNEVTVNIKGEDTSVHGTLKVTFLPKMVTQDELEKVFCLGEEVDLVSIKVNSVSENPYNFAYVNYGSYQDAQQAESRLNGISIYGSKICVRIQGRKSHNLHLNSASTRPAYPVPGLYSTGQPLAANFSSCTLKVSMMNGSVTAEILEAVFSNYGALRDKPIVRPGTPAYAYVNFKEPQSAFTAYQSLNNRVIGDVKIAIRVQQGQKRPSVFPPPAQTNTDHHSSLSHECRPVACRHLVARLLTMPSGKFIEQLQMVCQSQQVVVKPMKGGNGVNILGDKHNLSAAEVCVQLLIDKIEDELGQHILTLPSHFVPQFANSDILKRISEIEEKHSIEVLVLNESQQEEDPRLLVSFATSQMSNKSGTAITVSSFSKYLSCSSSTVGTTQSPGPVCLDQVWLWQDDDGKFTPYTPDLCKKINQQLKLTPTGSFTCTIPTKVGAATYSIDFSNMMQTNLETSNTRCIVHRTAGVPQWFYRDDTNTMVAYSAQDSAKIEMMMKSGSPSLLAINGRVYTFDFTKMVQTNVSTKYKRRIQRKTASDGPSTAKLSINELSIQLSVHGLSDNIPQAISDLKADLQKAVVKKKLTLPPSSDEAFCTSLLKTTHQYLVSTKIVNGKLEMEGMQSFIDSVELIVMKEYYAHEKKILSQAAFTQATEFPENWETQAEKMALKPVRQGSSEWNKVARPVQQTLSQVLITKIERIQNKWLWEKYNFSKQRMFTKNGGVVNEKMLFHGTRDTPPEKVFKSEQGFDFRFASSGLWGTGTYFAVNASYSEKYAHRSGAVKQLILANVLTGETYRSVPDSSLKKPPVKSRSLSSRLGSAVSSVVYGSSSATDDFEDELYDSVSGHAQGSDIFIIYDHEKAYPAYLITFR